MEPEHDEKRWPAVATLVTSWVVPARSAQRTDHVSLKRAYGMHWLGAVLAVGLIVVLFAWSQSRERRIWQPYSGGTWRQAARLIEDIGEEFLRDPKFSIAATAGTVVGVEAGFVLLGLLLVPWGARDERLVSSMANGLRRTWLQTSHALPVIFLCGVFMAEVSYASRVWNHGVQAKMPLRPEQPAGAPQPTLEWVEYRAALREYERERNAIWSQAYKERPWLVRHEEVVGYVCFAGVTWILWGLFRAVGAGRRVEGVERPPMCDACGYNLTAASMEGRCPECGEPVAASLGPDVRPGTLWDRRREVGRLRAWWRCCWDAILRPRWLGRQMRLSSDGCAHRSFLAMHVPVIFSIGAIGLVLFYAAITRRNPFVREPEVVWMVAPFAAYMGTAGALGLVLLAAWGTSMYYYVAERRNLLGGAMQVVSYSTGYLVLWAWFAVASMAGAALLAPWLQKLEPVVGVDEDVLAFGAWAVANSVWLGVYVLLVFRGVSGTRYANR